ncbi:MAG: hypothetical protein J1E59_01485 [Treponema sp.]|nr:hypothetical protein [Treponema sp.]
MKKLVVGMFALVVCAGMAIAEVTYCVSVKCSICKKTYELMDVSGKDQTDCENKAKKFVCNHSPSQKKAISAQGYCPKID